MHSENYNIVMTTMINDSLVFLIDLLLHTVVIWLVEMLFTKTEMLTFRHAEVEITKQRDKFKVSVCEKAGITLVVIPYWWNKNIESFAQTLYLMRPDVEINPAYLHGETVPMELPKSDKRSTEKVPLFKSASLTHDMMI